MNKRIKKTLKITGISLGVLIAILTAAIALALHFVFTPEKLTPAIVQAANRQLNAHLRLGSVELTFFSSFPRFGLKVTDGTLVSKALRDTLWQRSDTLLSFKKAVLVVNPIDYLTQQKITVYRLLLDSARVYAHVDKEGRTNWNILSETHPSTDTDTASTGTARIATGGIDIRRVTLRHATVTFDDRQARVFANLWDANLNLQALLQKEHSLLKVDFSNRNILFWQDGQLLVNRLSTHLQTDVELDRHTRTLTLNDALLNVNGLELDLKGTLRRDTTTRAADVNLHYSLHAPSLETVIGLIPSSILKKETVKAQGEVKVSGTLKGLYGKQQMPLATLQVHINQASAHYEGFPYGIDEISADFSGQVDLTKRQESYADLKIFHFKGAQTDILADARIDDLLDDPDIRFHTRSTIDLTSLAKAFPLQEGIHIEGKADADIRLRCRLSAIRNKDLGRIRIGGKLQTDKLMLKDTQRGFEFTSNASLAFMSDDKLDARIRIKNMNLRAPRMESSLDNLTATVSSTNPQDTTRLADVECKLEMNRLKARVTDSLALFCGRSKATVRLQPGKLNPSRPQIGLTLEADTLFCRMDSMRMGMDKAGIAITAEQVSDSFWTPKGIVGFNRMKVSTPICALPIQMLKTSLTVGNQTISLRNATLRIGRSDLTATGAVYDLYGAMRHHKPLRAKLDLTSNNLNCNQLIRSLSFPTDTLQAETDTTSTNLELFVVPKNVDFELTTRLRRVRYGKMVFENVQGAVDVRNQAIHLKELSMRGLDADIRTTLIYQARQRKQGYAGFDFRLHKINIGKLVDFVPSLDTIVPMLRSFQGTVDFNVAAESRLDSCLNIRIPTLRSAIHIKGDSLVLMDGETFAEISKKFLFKNKEKNMIDSISVNISVKDGNVTVYPFVIEMDRYRAAVGGTQDLDMNFDYHISILKSPIPFKLGLNIRGNMEDMKFGMGKAKYKDAVTPVEIHKVDSTIVHMGEQIVTDFKRVMRRP